MALTKDAYCSYCGAPFAPAQPWPRQCAACGEFTFRNPYPVAIVLQPIDRGILAVRRNIHPGFGELALPGGYIDYGETWQQAAAREMWEETGLRIDPGALHPFFIGSNPAGTFILIFALAPALPLADLPPFAPNDEVQECIILDTPIRLAFPLHTEALARYFSRRL